MPAGLQTDVGHGDVFRLRQRLDREQRDTAAECLPPSQDRWYLPARRLTFKTASQKMFPPSRPVLLGHTARRQRGKHPAERQRGPFEARKGFAKAAAERVSGVFAA